MSYCFICGNPTPGSFGKCQACVERLAQEELEREAQHKREERRVRLRILIKFFIVLLVIGGVGGGIFLRVVYTKEWDQFFAKQEVIFGPYVSVITGGNSTGFNSRKGGVSGGKDSFVAKNFTSGDHVLVVLKSKQVDCEIDSQEPDGVFVGNEVMYLKCDGEAAALFVFSDSGKAQEGLEKLNESKKYGLVNQVGNIIFAMVSSGASSTYERIRTALASV